MIQDRYRYMQFAIRTSDVDLKDWEELRDKMIAIALRARSNGGEFRYTEGISDQPLTEVQF